MYSKLCPVGSQPGKLYGLAKVHKGSTNGCPPFRPIISAINTPTYQLSKFLLPILEPITKNSFVIKDSFSFVDDIKDQNTNLFMSSFDVESLFTNIPLNETIEICINKLYPRKNMKIKGLRKKDLKTLLELATKESLFMFDHQYYRQLDGVAMGSPLGPTLANIFLCHYEEIWLQNCPIQFKPVFYKRYVDDTFLLFNDQDDVNKFNKYINSRHINMKFTNENESEKTLNFLDISIRRDQNFVTSIYRKPTFSGIYAHFHSYIPLDYKKGLIACLLFRLFNLSSNWSIIHHEIQQLRGVLILNKYPQGLIDSTIYKTLEKLIHGVKTPKEICDKKELVMVIPYLGKQSILIKKRLMKLFSSTYKDSKLKIVYKSTCKLRNIFSCKDITPVHLQSLVLYKFLCGSCNATYIGKTKRHCKIRMCEHLGTSYKTGKELKWNEANSTVVRNHLKNERHNGDFNNFKIVGFARNDFELLIKESLLINKLKPCLNKQVDSFQLLLF